MCVRERIEIAIEPLGQRKKSSFGANAQTRFLSKIGMIRKSSVNVLLDFLRGVGFIALVFFQERRIVSGIVRLPVIGARDEEPDVAPEFWRDPLSRQLFQRSENF